MKKPNKQQLCRVLAMVAPFWLLDLTLRLFAGSAQWYFLLAPAPNLFSIGFGALFAGLVLLLPCGRRVAYGVLYALWAVYAAVQFGVCRLLERFLYLSDFLFAGEGLGFAAYARQLLDGKSLLFVLLILLWGVCGVRAVPQDGRCAPLRLWMLGAFALTQVAAPLCYAPVPETADWDSWQSSGYEYRQFSSPLYDMALTGPYQFVLHDAMLSLAGQDDAQAQRAVAEAFLSAQPAHTKNEMTGVLAGKNLMIVQLESIDDFVLTAENMPTLARLQREGIQFTQFYTPQYANGYTFNTEFAAQTGVYPYANGNAAYSLARNDFAESIAARLADAGYRTASFHKSEAKFYNRGAMHQAFGYEAYHSALDYAPDELTAGIDRFLADNDALYGKMTENAPFCDFIITYSGHLGYDEYDEMTTYALSRYPQYADASRPYELNGLFAKARLTDELFARLLARLEQDGLLQNTVLCVYDDHYAYGLTDETLARATEDAGGGLLERTPCLIWYEGCTPLAVDKPMQTVDLLPTLANLFGLPLPPTLGRDAFDPSYEGRVIFADGFLTKDACVRGGETLWNNGVDADALAQLHDFARRFRAANDAILDCDYYAADA